MKKISTVLAVFFLSLLVFGCKSDPKEQFWGPEKPQWKPDSQIGDLCTVTDFVAVRVWGYGLVVGLPGTGSGDAPSLSIREHVTKQLQVLGKDRLPQQYQNQTVNQIIASNTTAIVEVSGIVPAAAPRGTDFDIDIEINWASRTSSLQGGVLLPCDLTVVAAGHRGNLIRGVVGAKATGPVYINTFSEKESTEGSMILHKAAVLNGGKSVVNRKITLKSEYPDYRLMRQLEHRINERFRKGNDPKVVYNTKDASILEISVPADYSDNYEHFIYVLLSMHLPGDTVFQQRKLDEIDAMISRGDLTASQWRDISLQWEAIGRQSMGHLRQYYNSSDDYAQFHAVRTALSLQDDQAVNRMVDIAMNDNHLCQMAAIRFLTSRVGDSRVYTRLERLLAHKNVEVQFEAYKSLSRNPGLAIANYAMPGDFRMDIVEGSQRGLIYIWAYRQPRIVIFGQNLSCPKNIFFKSQDETVLINSNDVDTDIKVIRVSLLTHQSIRASTTTFMVKDLIDALACPPAGSKPGLGLNFSQIAAIIKEMSEQGIIPAEVKVYTGPGSMERDNNEQ